MTISKRDSYRIFIKDKIENEKPTFNFVSYFKEITPNSDLIPIHISYNKKVYYANIATLGYVNRKITDYSKTGENDNGLYFRDKNLIIIKDLTRENIQKVLEDMARHNNLETLTQVHTV